MPQNKMFSFLKGVQVSAVVCNQFGDSGKGKIVDILAQWADVTARGTGGNNAGHTVVANGKKRIFHLIPSGILYDSERKINIMGKGMVNDLEVLRHELDELDELGCTYNNLMISRDAHVVMPYHVAMDQKNKGQENGNIGTTGRGIGPCYADKVARFGIRIRDLYDETELARQLTKIKDKFPERNINVDEIIANLKPLATRIQPLVRDTDKEIESLVARGKKINLEGAQGLFLSIDHGTYPYTTSSDCSVYGTAQGAGLRREQVDLTLGLVKFPFMTRVGAGPMPTEYGGRLSEEYCGQPNYGVIDELRISGVPFSGNPKCPEYDPRHPNILALMNSDNDFDRGVGIRLAAGEYGATTGRPRRIGRTDAMLGRRAVNINGPLLVLTKCDSIIGSEEFQVGFSYDRDFSPDSRDLYEARVQYRTYQAPKDMDELLCEKSEFQTAIRDFEVFTKGRAVLVGTGPDRKDIVERYS